MKTTLWVAAVLASALVSIPGTTPASATEANARVAPNTVRSLATDISARRRHHRHASFVRHYRPVLAFHHRYYPPRYRAYYRSYPAFATYAPLYRPYWPYRPYRYYRPAYYASPYFYDPYYGPRTYVSIGPFALGLGLSGIF
jgi:hypothetical protein